MGQKVPLRHRPAQKGARRRGPSTAAAAEVIVGAGCAVCERARERCVRGTRHALWLLAWVRAVGGSEFYLYGLPADPGEEEDGACAREEMLPSGW